MAPGKASKASTNCRSPLPRIFFLLLPSWVGTSSCYLVIQVQSGSGGTVLISRRTRLGCQCGEGGTALRKARLNLLNYCSFIISGLRSQCFLEQSQKGVEGTEYRKIVSLSGTQQALRERTSSKPANQLFALFGISLSLDTSLSPPDYQRPC